MKKKTIIIIIAVLSVLIVSLIAACAFYLIDGWLFPHKYVAAEDEIALYITLDVKEDIGLIVYDYSAGGRDFSGGVSNADRSMIKHDDVIISVWNKQQLECSSDTVDLTVRFRIITEYTDPNFENVYPEEITRYLEPICLNASFGKSYTVVITGDRSAGYTANVHYGGGDQENGDKTEYPDP